MDKYKFRTAKRNYPNLFEKEKKKLQKILVGAKIEHIGSTAIKGLGGKGIIDILLGVEKNKINYAKKKLISQNYIFKDNGGDKNRLFFEKDYGFLIKRRIHIQLTFRNSKIWRDAIKFRDKLRKNPLLVEKYSNLKKEAIRRKLKGKDYREFKAKFIKKILA